MRSITRSSYALFCGVLFSMSLAVASGAAPSTATAPRPFVSPIFGENMVLQRGKPNELWGWTESGAHVRVDLEKASVETRAGADGAWRVRIDPPPVGGPYELRITGRQSIVWKNVLVGDVWLCSGQSNMAMGLSAVADGATEVAGADRPTLRLFMVKQQPAYGPKSTVDGTWRVCSPASVAEGGWGGFSAVAYFFGRHLQEELNIPIGLVQSAVGGSPAESWMSPAALQAFPEFQAALTEIERLRVANAPEYGNFISHWYDDYDIGARSPDWASEKIDESDWTPVRLPGGFAELGVPETPAVAWFRREIVLPEPLPPGRATLHLGVVEKMDTAYLNGRWVGASSWVENPRAYVVPDGVLRPGKNRVTLRVFKLQKDGGLRSAPETLRLQFASGTTVPLAGAWRGKLSVDARPPHPLPLAFENYPTLPAVLHHGMLAPLAPIALTGVIWYQGEANTNRALQYRRLMPALISDWRALFQQGDFPFYMVGLPAFTARRDTPGDDGWAELREAQALTARTTANAEVAVTIDTGEADDIHPKDKRTVGERLARLALARHYGRDMPYAGPRFSTQERLPGALRLRFENVSGKLSTRGAALGEFAVAGADRKWHWAEARIEGEDAVVVSSPEVAEPVAARYAWQANPAATLVDSAGLPAMPFRTDDWPLSTAAHAEAKPE